MQDLTTASPVNRCRDRRRSPGERFWFNFAFPLQATCNSIPTIPRSCASMKFVGASVTFYSFSRPASCRAVRAATCARSHSLK